MLRTALIATLTAATAFGNTRYRTAAEASLVILAAVAVDALATHWWSPSWSPEPEPSQEPAAHPPGGSS